ncbi:hypothetical protein ACM614_17160 [Streptomyces sp. 12297]|uniref:hypothetical protein n=1 Tax=Streptomyces sp. NBC_00239 TaxID=2903640 RepID=UPI002E2E750E|nr:hypothetical protein [Streptomyces sp. NBC_00239]
MQTTMLRRSAAAALALSATLTGLAVTPALAAPTPSYDFGDCPAIPAGVDAARWKCEVLTATGSMQLGNRYIPELTPMTITHAEGPLPDGTKGQVWGALRGGPTPVPGGVTGHPSSDRSRLLSLALQPEYGGRSDFYSVGENMGLFTLRYRAVSPLLPQSCVIGGGDTPIEIRLKRIGSSEWVSKNPPVIKFAATDTAFTVPAATGCGPLGRLLNDRLDLPAQTGNTITLSALYTFKTYDQLPAR